MPEAILFAACEKGVVDLDTSRPSLIGVFRRFELTATPTEADTAPGETAPDVVAKGVVLSIPWCAMSYWTIESEAQGKTYRLRCQVLKPDGTIEPRLSDEYTTTFENITSYAGQFNFSGFVYSGVGTYTLRLSIREDGESTTWKTAAEYPLTVTTAAWRGLQPAI